MKKNILKAMMALCLCGLLIVSVNVMAYDGPPINEQQDTGDTGGDTGGGSTSGGGGDCPMVVSNQDGLAIITNAKNRWLARGCKQKCGYVCSINKVNITIGI